MSDRRRHASRSRSRSRDRGRSDRERDRSRERDRDRERRRRSRTRSRSKSRSRGRSRGSSRWERGVDQNAGVGGGGGGSGGLGRPTASVIVRNLPLTFLDSDLQLLVPSAMGTRLIRDRNTGESRGFGFAEFASPFEAERFMNNGGQLHVQGRPLSLEYSSSQGDGLGHSGQGIKMDWVCGIGNCPGLPTTSVVFLPANTDRGSLLATANVCLSDICSSPQVTTLLGATLVFNAVWSATTGLYSLLLLFAGCFLLAAGGWL